MTKAKRAVDIVQLIRHYVPQLGSAGRQLRGHCPFHHQPEKSPSLVVSPEKQIFHCLRCGATGDAVSFLMRAERLSYGDALSRLSVWPKTALNTVGNMSRAKNPIRTGFPQLDKVLCGGLRKGALAILASRAAQGKTSLALQIASHAALRDKGVLFFTADLTRFFAMQRLIGFRARVNAADLHSGYFDRKKWPAFKKAAARFASAPLFLVDKPKPSMEDIQSISYHLADSLKSKRKGISLIVIDPLQHIQLESQRFPNRRAEISEIMFRAKRLAAAWNVAVLVISQLPGRRKGRVHDFAQTMTDLERSGITEHFDNAILLHGTRRNSATTLDAQARLLIVKGPAGAMQECVLHFDPAIGMFTNARTK